MLIEAHANVGFLAVVESSDQTKTPSESTSQNIHAAMGTILMNSQRSFDLFLNGANPSVPISKTQFGCKTFVFHSLLS